MSPGCWSRSGSCGTGTRRSYGTFRTRDLILDAYDAMADATPDRPFVSRLDPPPGDPRAAHPPRPGEDPGHWIPWSEVLARAPQAVPAARSVRTAAAAARQAELGRPGARDPGAGALPVRGRIPRRRGSPRPPIAPSEIMMGARVRHRAKGEGTVLSVRPSGKSTELLIRFDATGEAWIVFGYGVLEFQAEVGE